MENIQKINIDIVNHKVYEYIYSKQWDEGRIVEFNITDDNKTIAPTNYVMFQMKKPDGYVVLYTCEIIDGKAKVVLSRQMTAVAGKIPYQLNIYSAPQTTPEPEESVDPSEYDGNLVSTVTGYIIVEASVVQPDDVESKDEFNVINEMAKELGHIADILENDGEKIIQAANDSIEYAKRSKSYAVGGTDYDHDGVDDDEDNSKYYYEMTKGIYNTAVVTKIVTLYADRWDTDNKTQRVEVDNVIENEDMQLIVVRPKEEFVPEYSASNVMCVHQGDGFLDFTYRTKPSIDMDVFVMVQTSDAYDKTIVSYIIYAQDEPSGNAYRKHDFWVQPYEEEEQP